MYVAEASFRSNRHQLSERLDVRTKLEALRSRSNSDEIFIFLHLKEY